MTWHILRTHVSSIRCYSLRNGDVAWRYMHRRNVAKTAKPKKTRCRRCIFVVLELIVGIGRQSFSRHLSKAGRLLAHSAKTFWSPMKNRSIYHMHMYIFIKKLTATLISSQPKILRSALWKRDAFCMCCLPRSGRLLKQGTANMHQRERN